VFFSPSSFTNQKAPADVVITVALVQLPVDFWQFSTLLAKAEVATVEGVISSPSQHTFVCIKKVKLVYKPSSVLDDHLSRRFVAKPLMRFWGRTSSPIVPHLAPRRVYSHNVSPQCGVSPYLTFPPLLLVVNLYITYWLAVYLCCPFP